MANEITNSEVTDLVVNNFTLESGGKTVTPSSLLGDWDANDLTIIFSDIRRDLSDKGYLIKTLSSRDLSDDKKVGKTVGTLADAIFADLIPKPVTVASRAAASSLDRQLSRSERFPLDSTTAAYMQGYKDATLKVIGHVLRRRRSKASGSSSSKSMKNPAATQRKSKGGAKRRRGK